MPTTSEYWYAIELIKSGEPTKEAAKKIGITYGGLVSWLYRNDIKVSDLRNKPREEPRKHIGGMYHGVITTDQAIDAIGKCSNYVCAAKHFGVEHQSFKAWCRKNGIKVKEIIDGTILRPEKPFVKASESIFYEQATVKDILIRNKWDGGLSLCA